MSAPILCLSSVQLARLGAVEIHVCVCKTSLVYISNQSSTQRLATGVESRINIELVCSPSFAIILLFKSTFTFKHLLVDFSFSLQSIALNSFLCHAPWRNGMFRHFLNRICPQLVALVVIKVLKGYPLHSIHSPIQLFAQKPIPIAF